MSEKLFHKAKKSLGQNFLKSEPALRKIIESGDISSKDIVLEIGPGKGALTERLLEKAGHAIAIEKDLLLFNFLLEKFSGELGADKLELRNEDILDFRIKHAKYKIIANIPYNITGAILKKFLAGDTQPEKMVLMVQKEVGERIVARDGKESLLSISVKAYGKPKVVMKVSARYFSPAPKVDSCIVEISDISREFFIKNDLDEEKFWFLVKKGFSHKRKKLSGNLKNTVSKEVLTETGFGDKRAEDLSLLDWLGLARKCYN